LCGALVGQRPARAQTTRPITNNNYAVEFYQGPLIAPANVEGLAGATTAIASGVSGSEVNAAAPAVREPFSFNWVDVDVNAGISFPGAFSTMDYDNHGPGSHDQVNDFLYADFGLNVQLGDFGVSASGDLLRYSVVGTGGLDVTAGRYHVLAAYGIDDNQFVFGAGFRAVTMQLSQGQSILDTFNPVGASLTMSGLGPEVGTIIKPNDLPFRLGATFRAPVTGTNLGPGDTTTSDQGVVRSGGVIIPDSITMPWELEAGLAIQIGPRPLNPAWHNPHEDEAPVRDSVNAARERRAITYAETLAETVPAFRAARSAELAREDAAIRVIEDQRVAIEDVRLKAARKARYQALPREKILFVASVLVTGASNDAIALEDFFDQHLESYGNKVTLSPRVGLETEAVKNHAKVRIGSYLEPSRFDGVEPRGHFTTGFDVKLFRWEGFGLFPGQVWRLTGAADAAPRYTDWGLSVGAWH
jgi:hypothetical protein